MDDLPQPIEDIDYRSRKKIAWIVFLLLSICLIASVIYYFTVYRFYQSTDNAYVQADVTWIMPKVSGEVVDLKIKNNQMIKQGEIVATLDNRDYQARYEQAKSLLAIKEAALQVQTENEKSAKSNIAEAESGRSAIEVELNRLRGDYERYQDLLKDGVITRQYFENTRAQYLSTQAQVSKANAAVDSAKAQLGSLQASRAQLLADLQSGKASQDLYQIDLSATKIVSPVSGRIGNLSIRMGSRVTPQTRLMAIIPEKSIYIEANFKETQIEKMRLGQKVELRLDAYPSLMYSGKIESFSPASGATFSLMPPDNASGNFNKVVQRIPVRISIDAHPQMDLVKPGMSVIAKVDLRT